MPYTLRPHLTRKITVLSKDDPSIPQALFTAKSEAPDLDGFPCPLPSKKSDYTCFAEGNNGVFWYGGLSGLTRYDSKTDRKADKIMYFSACRHLADNKVDAITGATKTSDCVSDMVRNSLQGYAAALKDLNSLNTAAPSCCEEKAEGECCGKCQEGENAEGECCGKCEEGAEKCDKCPKDAE